MNQGWAKIKPAAEYAGIKERTLRGWLKNGLRHARLPTGTILIKLTEVDAYLEGFSGKESEVDKITSEIMKELN